MRRGHGNIELLIFVAILVFAITLAISMGSWKVALAILVPLAAWIVIVNLWDYFRSN
jgi:hypothetical protein